VLLFSFFFTVLQQWRWGGTAMAESMVFAAVVFLSSLLLFSFSSVSSGFLSLFPRVCFFFY
jgi:hypothetical protein